MAENKELNGNIPIEEAENAEKEAVTAAENAPTADEKEQTSSVIFEEEGAEAEADEALSSFLSHEQETNGKKPVKKGINKRLLAVIISILAVGALVAVLLLIRSTPKAQSNQSEDLDPAAVSLSVNEDGEHQASVDLDEDGNIKHNGNGNLLSYVPADISKIHVENTGGSFDVVSETPEGEATVYTLVGFEGYTLQDGIADAVANDASSVDFVQIASNTADPADFGLDNPTAVVKVSFNDDTTAAIYVGNKAAGEAGTYISFGDNKEAVYLVEDDAVDSFLYSVTDFISSVVNSSAEDTEDSEFISATISGTNFPEPITLVPNTDEAVDAAYIVTEPKTMYANATESSDIAGSIRGIYAESVVCVNPSDDQMASYGLSDPFAAIVAEYPDTTVNLSASAPLDDGITYLYNPDTNVVYTIQLSAISWAVTNVKNLTPETVINAKSAYVKTLSFKSGDTDFDLDITTTTTTVEGENNTTQEVNNTVAKYGDKELEEDFFAIFFQNLNGIKLQDSEGESGSEVMSFTLSYTTDKADDTVVIYSNGSAKYSAELNGEIIGTVSKSYIDSLTDGSEKLIAGEAVPSL